MTLRALSPDLSNEKRARIKAMIKTNKITISQKKEIQEFPEKTLVIDMTNLYDFY